MVVADLDGDVDGGTDDTGGSVDERRKKVLTIMVDGWRPDVIYTAETPTIDGLWPDSAYSLQARFWTHVSYPCLFILSFSINDACPSCRRACPSCRRACQPSLPCRPLSSFRPWPSFRTWLPCWSLPLSFRCSSSFHL
jgi:hypothetical protein